MANRPKNGVASLCARVNFPLFTIKVLSERHILVAGGGGEAKTGVANSIEIYELSNSPDGNTCDAIRIMDFSTGSRAVMNSAVFVCNDQLLLAAGGPGGMSQLYELKFAVKQEGDQKLNGPRSHSPNGIVNGRERHNSESLRRRRTSSTSSQKENNHGNEHDNNVEETRSTSKSRSDSVNKQKTNGHGKSNGKPRIDSLESLPSVTFNLAPVKSSVQVDFNNKPNDEPFYKVAKFCKISEMLITGGADGKLRLWQMPEFELLKEIVAHTNDVDDIDVDPIGNSFVSVSRDGHGYVWNLRDGKKAHELNYVIPVDKNSNKPPKYIFRGCRYGIVENDRTKTVLFTILNPLVRQKPPGKTYICKWNTSNYTLEKMVDAGIELLSNMAISDDGTYLGVGTQDGSVKIYTAYNLKQIYSFQKAHNQFVTGVEFLRSCNETKMLCGDHDASLISVSADNKIIVHHVPKQVILGFLGFSLMYIVTLLLVYFLIDFLGL